MNLTVTARDTLESAKHQPMEGEMGADMFTKLRDIRGEGNDARDGTDTDGILVDSSADPFVIAKTIDMTSVPLLTHDSFDDLAVDPPNPNLETYDWPGEYAQRFDGDDKGGDTFDFQPQLTTEPTAPGEDVMCQNNLRIGDSFSFTDYKPTESLAVDPTNPDVGSSGHTGGANFVFCDGAVRSDEGPQFTTEPTAPQAGGGHEDWIKVESCQLGDPITFTLTIDAPSPAYDDPQLIAIYTRTGYATLETGPAVAMESLTIANEGFLV